jgi:kumamolisin
MRSPRRLAGVAGPDAHGRRPARRLARARSVGLALLFVVPALASVIGPAAAAPSSQFFQPAGPAFPAALLAPQAARYGFDTTEIQEVSDARPAVGPVTVSVTLWPRDPSLLAGRPASAPPLSLFGLTERYSPSAATYAGLIAYFESRGLSVVHAWPDRLSLTVAGPAAAVSTAFGTRLEQGIWHGRPVRFPSTVPSLPADVASSVAAISGLSAGFDLFTTPLRTLGPLAGPTGASPISPTQGRTTTLVSPSAVHKIYDLDSLYNFSGSPHWATGQGIALLLWGRGYDPSDLATFFSQYYPAGFPPLTIVPHPVDGAPPPGPSATSDPSGAAQELTLDIEWAGSAAPGATLHAVYAPDGSAANGYSPSDPSMEDALNTAISIPGVHVVSMSFGTLDGSDAQFQAAYSIAFASAAARGITLLGASGDNGGTTRGGCAGAPAPQFPAASPDVIAVGGTAPVLSESAVGGITGLDSEPAWNASGGGFSTQYPAPSWQLVGSAKGPIASSGNRGIPDVAGPAYDDLFYFRGTAERGQGTSFATPLWAGIVAEMDALRNQSLGFVTPRLYAVGAAEESGFAAPGLVDVTSGANCLGPASRGWDTATGWGTPRGLLLYEDLVASFVDVGLTLRPASVAPGSSFEAVVQVTNASSHRPIADVPVNLSLQTPSGYVGPCGGSFGSAVGTTDGNGTATVTLQIPGCYLGSQASITASVLANGFFGSNSTTVGVNLLGWAGFLAVIQQFPYNVIAFGLIILVAIVVGVKVGDWRHRRELRRRPPPPAVPPPGVSGATPGPGSPGPLGPPRPPNGPTSASARRMGAPASMGGTPGTNVPRAAGPVPRTLPPTGTTRPSPDPLTTPRPAGSGPPVSRPVSPTTATRAAGPGLDPGATRMPLPVCPSCSSAVLSDSGTCPTCGSPLAPAGSARAPGAP